MASVHRLRSRSQFFFDTGSMTTTYRHRITGNVVAVSTTDAPEWAPMNASSDDYFETDGAPYTTLHPLSLISWEGKPPVINGTTPEIRSGLYMISTAYQRYTTLPYVNWHSKLLNVPMPSAPSTVWLETKALSQAPQSSPPFDPWLFYWELKEFPRLLQSLGNFLAVSQGRRPIGFKPTTAPDSFLEYSFGWLPLISDVQSLFDAAEAINSHLKNLRKVRNGMGFRMRLYDESRNTVSVRTIGSASANVSFDETQVGRYEAWATGRYVPRDIDKIDSLINSYASRPRTVRSLFSRGLEPVTIWNAIPWSWLIDYFINIGDFIEATSGLSYADMADVCIMIKETRAIDLTPSQATEGLSGDSGYYSYSRKSRTIRSILHPRLAGRPIITDRVASILGALALSRTLRGN